MKKYLRLHLITSLIALSISACNSGGQTNDTSTEQNLNQAKKLDSTLKNDNSFPSSNIISLGSPYASTSETVISPFSVDVLDDATTLEIRAATHKVKYSFDFNQTIKSNEVNGEITLRGELSGANGNIVANFLDSKNSNAYHVSYFYSFSDYLPVSLSEPNLKIIFSNGAPLDIYGDAFVKGVNMGLFTGIHIDFSSDSVSAINALNAALSIKYKDDNNIDLDAILNKIDSNTKSKISLTVRGIQLGGDPTEFAKSLHLSQYDKSENGAEYGFKEVCSKDSFNACLSIVRDFESYANGQYNAQVYKYITELFKKNRVEYKDIKSTLFPFNNDLDHIQTGKYIDKETNAIYNPKIDYTVYSTLSNADINLKQILYQSSMLKNMQTLTDGKWKVESLNIAQNVLTDSYTALINAVKDNCLDSVLQINAKRCKNTINKVIQGNVTSAIDLSLAVIDSFKGYRLYDANINVPIYLVYIGGENFFLLTTPDHYMTSPISPGIWKLSQNGYITTTSVFDNTGIRDDYYSSVSPGIEAYFGEKEGKPTLVKVSGTLTNKNGDKINITQNLAEEYLPLTW